VGEISEFSLPVRAMLRLYRWRQIDPVPWVSLEKPLAECRLAVVSSAGFVHRGQAPFDESIKGGDFSFREIPNDADVSELTDFHRSKSYDHTGMAQDPNLAFPLDRVREMAESGRVGSLARSHISFMGSITAPGRLIRHTAPAAAQKLVDDEVDIALLVPV
jgi:D-proline reductase (dithiol) PrdB